MTKAIKDFEDYTINDSGDNEHSVWSLKNNQWMKPKYLPSGYAQICFSVDGIHHRRYLHQLLGIAFIPNLENKPTINHKNHNRSDNRLENLEWATKPEQMDDITRENISKARKGQHNSPSTEFKKGMTPWMKGKHHSEESKKKISKSKSMMVYQYEEGELVGVWENAQEAADELGYNKDCIQKCCRGIYKQHKGCNWSYTIL